MPFGTSNVAPPNPPASDAGEFPAVGVRGGGRVYDGLRSLSGPDVQPKTSRNQPTERGPSMIQPQHSPAWVVGVLVLCALGVCAAATASYAADGTPTPGGAGHGPAAAPKSGAYHVYVGTYTGPKSKGIYLLRLDLASGALTPMGVAGETSNPSFLALDPTRRFLYSADEVDNFQGKKAGAVSAFSVDPDSGKLTLLNRQSSGGPGPCYVSVDATGKAALVANYTGGSVESLPIGPDGKLGEPATFIQHQGS